MPYNLLYQSALAKLIGKVVRLVFSIKRSYYYYRGYVFFIYLIAGLINSNN